MGISNFNSYRPSTYRFFFLQQGSEIYSKGPVMGGVRQGTILVPLLYIIYKLIIMTYKLIRFRSYVDITQVSLTLQNYLQLQDWIKK